MSWNVYWWKAGKQFIVGSNCITVDMFGRGCFTIRHTASRYPRTLVKICSLEEFHRAAPRLIKDISPRFTLK